MYILMQLERQKDMNWKTWGVKTEILIVEDYFRNVFARNLVSLLHWADKHEGAQFPAKGFQKKL